MSLRTFILSLLLTRTERAKLAQPLLTAEQRVLAEAITQPDRFQPDPIITPDEAKAWGATLNSPLGLKIDVAMINMTQQQAQRAVFAPGAEAVRMAGVAAGWRLAWAFAKSISTLHAADGVPSETDADTAADPLSHIRP